MKNSSNLAIITLAKPPLKVAIAKPNPTTIWLKVVWPCYTMRVFEESKISMMPLGAFAPIVWFTFSPFAPKVLSTSSSVHYVALFPPFLLKGILKGTINKRVSSLKSLHDDCKFTWSHISWIGSSIFPFHLSFRTEPLLDLAPLVSFLLILWRGFLMASSMEAILFTLGQLLLQHGFPPFG